MFHNLYQQLFISLRGRESPISYIQKVIETTPQNRKNWNLQGQFEDYQKVKDLLLLMNGERIALDMLLHHKDFHHMVNELLHLFFLFYFSWILRFFISVNLTFIFHC